jgi:monofunctional biosynthetic peptidoglycan transglycosylase
MPASAGSRWSFRGRGRKVGRVALTLAAGVFGIVCYVYLTLPDVRVLAKSNPASTAFMELRAAEAARDGRMLRHLHRWVPYARISPNLKRAVLVAEDSAFWDHDGIDYEEVRAAIRVASERGTAIRGASTITQQLAKNLYLSPSRDPLRKLKELIIARRLEAALTKARIFEIYLNVIEWGDGIWGIEAASRTYFGVPASALGREQSALLAGAIINPRVLTPARPTRRLLRRQQIILGRMGGVELAPERPARVEAASATPARSSPPPVSLAEEEAALEAAESADSADVPTEPPPPVPDSQP